MDIKSGLSSSGYLSVKVSLSCLCPHPPLYTLLGLSVFSLNFCLCLLLVHSRDKYNLFEHNCNTFSNEVAQFLTGKKIPSYITDLPSEVLST